MPIAEETGNLARGYRPASGRFGLDQRSMSAATILLRTSDGRWFRFE
jgi:hypothetical protein